MDEDSIIGSQDLMPSGYLVTEDGKAIRYANQYARQYLGRDNLTDAPLFEILTQASQILFESFITPMLGRNGVCDEIQLTLKASEGELRSVVANIRRDPVKNHDHWTFINSSQRDKLFQELIEARDLLDEKTRILETRTLADEVTGLPNRLAAAEYLTKRLNSPSEMTHGIVVVFIDLDDFKAINDRWGHDTGDQLLKAVGHRLTGFVKSSDLVVRYGGDEFIILLEQLPNGAAIDCLMIQRLLYQLSKPFEINGHSLTVSASAGASRFVKASPVEPEQLIRQADQAMYEAKVSGKGRVRWFDFEQETHRRTHHKLTSRIRRGIQNDEFVLHYQPKINLTTKAITGAEALIRWEHPTLGLLPPAEFLPGIENEAIGNELGDWVIRTALAQANHWHCTGLPVPVSVNVTVHQLLDPHFIERVSAHLGKYPNLPNADFELELLESTAMADNKSIVGVIDACKKLGLQVSLDDFGTGYSTLSNLRDLAVDTLKIDRGFVSDMTTNQSNIAIIKGIIGFANAFNCDVIAEGIETEGQLAELIRLGCVSGQGYLISQPLTADAFESLMLAQQPEPALFYRAK